MTQRGTTQEKDDEARPLPDGARRVPSGVHTSASDLLCGLFAPGWASLRRLEVLEALFALTLLCRAALGPCDQGLVPAKRVGIQHLQQQVVDWDHVFALHVEQVFHALVTMGTKRC